MKERTDRERVDVRLEVKSVVAETTERSNIWDI